MNENVNNEKFDEILLIKIIIKLLKLIDWLLNFVNWMLNLIDWNDFSIINSLFDELIETTTNSLSEKFEKINQYYWKIKSRLIKSMMFCFIYSINVNFNLSINSLKLIIKRNCLIVFKTFNKIIFINEEIIESMNWLNAK